MLICFINSTCERNGLSEQENLRLNFTLKNMSKLGFLVGSQVRKPSAIQETRVRSLDREDTLEKGMATHSSIRAWRIPWMAEPGSLQSMGLQRVRHKVATEHTH